MKKTLHIEGKGDIHYWISSPEKFRQSLVFLPGLTADHRLFEAQIQYFSPNYQTIVWDAPAHNQSRPFSLDFSLMDMAEYLHRILETEQVQGPILIGQSLGGYISQCYMEKYPSQVAGFVSIDSAPLKRKYMSSLEIWSLKHTEPMYKCFSWRSLINSSSKGCAVSKEGQRIMKEMMLSYEKDEFISLTAYGFKILAQAIEADLPYQLSCPTLLICGEKDMAGYTKSYNRKWSKKEKLSLEWIKNAGHNSNTDCPEQTNSLIEKFISEI